MKVTQLKRIIREEIKSVLIEKYTDTTLYKVHFNPEYSRDYDTAHKPLNPVFVRMTNAQRNRLSNFAAVRTIGGHGNITPDRLNVRDTQNTTEMEPNELFKLLKSLRKVKLNTQR